MTDNEEILERFKVYTQECSRWKGDKRYGPPKTISIHRDDYHASNIGRTGKHNQFFTTKKERGGSDKLRVN